LTNFQPSYQFAPFTPALDVTIILPSAKKVLEQLMAKGVFGEKRRKDIVRDSQSYYFLKNPNGKAKL